MSIYYRMKKYILGLRVPRLRHIGLTVLKIWRKFGTRYPCRLRLIQLFGVAAVAAATSYFGRIIARSVQVSYCRYRSPFSLRRLEPYEPLDRRGRRVRQGHNMALRNAYDEDLEQDAEEDYVPRVLGLPLPQAPILPRPEPFFPPREAILPAQPLHILPPPPLVQPEAQHHQVQPVEFELAAELIDQATGLPKVFVESTTPFTRSKWAKMEKRGNVPPISQLKLPDISLIHRGRHHLGQAQNENWDEEEP